MYQARFVTSVSALFLLSAFGFAEESDSLPGISKEDQERRKSIHYFFKGRRIFESQCAPCHGTTGRGNGPWSVDLKDKPRNFRKGIFKFSTTPAGNLPTTDDLRRTIRSGVSGTAMPAFKKMMDSDLDGVIVYLQNLSRRWDDESLYANPIDLPETPTWFRSKEALKEHAIAGGQLFGQICATCHGVEGNGDGPNAKGLMDVWGHPIIPAALTNAHHKSGDHPSDLYRTIATGLDGTPMIGFYPALKQDQIWDLVAWIKANEQSS